MKILKWIQCDYYYICDKLQLLVMVMFDNNVPFTIVSWILVIVGF